MFIFHENLLHILENTLDKCNQRLVSTLCKVHIISVFRNKSVDFHAYLFHNSEVMLGRDK